MVSFGGLIVSKVLFFTFILCHCCRRVCSLDLITGSYCRLGQWKWFNLWKLFYSFLWCCMNNVIHNILVPFALISLLYCGINIIRKGHVNCSMDCVWSPVCITVAVGVRTKFKCSYSVLGCYCCETKAVWCSMLLLFLNEYQRHKSFCSSSELLACKINQGGVKC